MRLIDADPFDRSLYHIPDDVYDPQSYAFGVEAVLNKIRQSDTVIQIDDKDKEAFLEWLKSCPIR